MHMIKKGQLDGPKGQTLSAADQFHSLAFRSQMRCRASLGSTSLLRHNPFSSLTEAARGARGEPPRFSMYSPSRRRAGAFSLMALSVRSQELDDT